jgi:hypothetical protein
VETGTLSFDFFLFLVTNNTNQPISLSMALQPFVGPWPLFQFLDLFTQKIGLLGRGISPSQGRYLHTEQHKQNKRTQTCMSQVGFEPTIPVFENAKTVHTSDRAATLIGKNWSTYLKIPRACQSVSLH